MDRKPLLTFPPQKTNETGIDSLPGGGDRLITPSLPEQYTKFSPRLNSLERQFAEHIRLTDCIEGLTPEKILVLEISGSIQNFTAALNKIQGFEGVQHLFSEEQADDQFYTQSKDGKKSEVKRELYLTMSSQEGIRRLKSLWDNAANNIPLDRGYTPLQHALEQLHDIRYWDVNDRIKETGLLEDWQYRLEDSVIDSQMIPFEIELWFKPTPEHRQLSERLIERIIHNHGGNITGRFAHEGIAYHALRGELPIEAVNLVLSQGGDNLQLMRCDEVMYFRPLGQCGAGSNKNINPILENIQQGELPSTDPKDAVVALLDGLPLEGHTTLKGRIVVDDPDNFSDLYTAPSQQVHGTSMASLIIQGDLSGTELPLETPLYVRPIMAPIKGDMDGRFIEAIPDNYLPLDLIHRAVKRIFEGEGDTDPVAPNVKVINLSVCDPSRLFYRNMSPWARMIDWLSEKYGVLFLVSGGNHVDNLSLTCTESQFKTLSNEEKQNEILRAIQNTRTAKRLMSPAESINAITTNASHSDFFEGEARSNVINPFLSDSMFSPVNPISLGKHNSIKPEIMIPGGRVTYRPNLTLRSTDPLTLSVENAPKTFGPGQKVAVPSPNPGELNGMAYSYGTSNANALASRRIALLHETIKSMREFEDSKALDFAPESVILKALLVHGAELPASETKACMSVFKNAENSRTYKREQSQFFGFGKLNELRIHSCAPNQATLLATGRVKLDHHNEHKFPLPPCLSGKVILRRLVITLAWFAPINANHHEYKKAQLWVSDPKKSDYEKLFDKGHYYHHHLKNGTTFHDIITGDKASPYTEGDSLSIQVNCKPRAGSMSLEIPYALVVTLDTEDTGLPIYEEVSAILQRITVNA
ncbi:MAG: S8 family peptidase [Reinekea sp.]